ncbi:MAG: glycosyltransferase [Candidatus Dojkabacteria bacterium]
MFIKVKLLVKKSGEAFQEGGGSELLKRTKKYILKFIKRKLLTPQKKHELKDILFIYGCDIDHPKRYRVDHQYQQLLFNNFSCEMIWYEDITMEYLKYFHGFVICRCPLTDSLENFITVGKYHNKTFYYDIDDLVIDEVYSKEIEYVKTMPDKQRLLHFQYIRDYQACLKLCDHAITTTAFLASELSNYIESVFINRNVVSEELLLLSENARKNTGNAGSEVRIGYLSGSKTHNPDLELIQDALIRILQKNTKVVLVLVGLVDVPKKLLEYKEQIEIIPFMDWQKLPEVLCNIDINVAPLVDTPFNQSKSENKWTEAALVKVPTVASKVGAFEEVIKHSETGILCNNTGDEWFKTLDRLIKNNELRSTLGKRAYEEVIKKKLTVNSGYGLAQFIKSSLHKSVAFVVPGTVVRGGINVIIKHCNSLRKEGYDVSVLSNDEDESNIVTKDGELLVISNNKTNVLAHFDQMVATLYDTVPFVTKYPKVSQRRYLVQSFETNFFEPTDIRRLQANSTYSLENFEYLTISLWCQGWLKHEFNKESKFCPNGLDLDMFPFVEKDFTGEITILIEGNSQDVHKNTDESFRIANKLDRSRFKIWYLSYDKKPKTWYLYDKFYHQVPYSEVGKIYQEAHILLKSSTLESFSYPPLEMMATGGVAIIAGNKGNAVYALHESNCLIYEAGDETTALSHIDKVVGDCAFRKKLIDCGRKTAEEYAWKSIEADIINLYK